MKGGFHILHTVKLSKTQSPNIDEEIADMIPVPYDSVVGLIMHAMTCTRRDMSYALRMVSRFHGKS